MFLLRKDALIFSLPSLALSLFQRLGGQTAHSPLVFLDVCAIDASSVWVGGAVAIGISEQRLHRSQQHVHRVNGFPHILDNVQAQGSIGVHWKARKQRVITSRVTNVPSSGGTSLFPKKHAPFGWYISQVNLTRGGRSGY